LRKTTGDSGTESIRFITSELIEHDMDKKFSLIMPMSGRGKRFKDEGILTPKPMILMGGTPLWGHAFRCLPLEMIDQVVFIEHVDNPVFGAQFEIIQGMMAASGVRSTLVQETEALRGAATSVLEGLHYVEDEKPLIISNCDQVYYGSGWPFAPKDVLAGKVDGLIPCFHGEGPKWSYAVTNKAGNVAKIVEKPKVAPSNLATVGVYYAARAHIIRDAIHAMMNDPDSKVNGEYYLAPCYNYMPGRVIAIEQATDMFGLGTPEDLDVFANAHKHLAMELDWREVNKERYQAHCDVEE
jgi:dTDP-glucose pyrophosphorylase